MAERSASSLAIMANKPSLEDLLKGVPPEKLNQPCRDDHLSEIALSVTEWRSISPFLGLTEADEAVIQHDYPESITRKIGMLRKWKKMFGKKATYRKLGKVFFKLERADLVEKVCELLQTESSSSSCEEDDPTTAKRTDKDSLDTYAEYLRGCYSTELPAFFTLQWPPPPTHKVFNLAMIGHQTIQRGPIDEELVRLTLRGNVDDIMRTKSPIELRNLFKLDNSKRKIILIEGAPGAGKSTLAWHICQKWESGELFQDFKVVVFVQLRDSIIQQAKSLNDVLLVESDVMRREVMSELLSCRGRNVVFVLDGWDEYGGSLRGHSFFQQLICSPRKVNMQFSSVVITSRPIASGELQRYASSRVEIIGFTSAEVNKYFSESIGECQTVQKLQDHLRERPVIEASCYLPLNAAIVVHLFLALNHTLPHTLHEVFLSLVLCCIIRHLTKEGEEIAGISSLDDLPPDVQKPFNNICTMAYRGVMKNKATFSAADLQSFNLPTELSTLSLIQGVQSYITFQRSVSYNFLHLSVQELLAAFHISILSANEQIQIFNDLFDQPRLAAVFRFYAAFTKLQTEGVRDIVARIVQKQEKPLLVNLLHGLYEAQDPSLCQFVASHLKGELDLCGNTLSPMDCLVVGYFLSCVCLTTSGAFKVNLNSCSLDDYRVSFLVRELSKSSSSTDAQTTTRNGYLVMDLSGNGIQENGGKAIGDVLIMNTSLQVLDLHKNNIGEKGCKAIGDGLMVNRFLQVLDIHGNPISAGVVHIAESLKYNHSLLEINLGGCRISEEESEAIGNALIMNTSLQVLGLHKNNIGEKGCKAIGDGLMVNRSLQVLDLHGNPISAGVVQIAESLKHNYSLRKINLGVFITANVAESLATSLKDICSLRTLRMNRKLSDECVAHIADCLIHNNSVNKLVICDHSDQDMAGAETLKDHGSLLEINFSDCDISEKGVESLFAFLKASNSVQTLILNKLSDGGTAHIAEVLRHNNCLKTLQIYFGSSDQGMESLASALEVNHSLEELSLTWKYAVTGVGLLSLGENLKRNRGLKTLRFFLLSYIITVSDWKQFMLCLQENCHLTKLIISSHISIQVVKHELEAVNNARRRRNLPLLEVIV